ncbi:hypothetical protein QTG54_012706 [Skeletonema marinoi]|uniref:Uncharacterized protein n=1 Tax=Skeletonema marinoi TaxID=267567 RepID=A0AAD8XZU8_9STRA|nr:hypothetical protein QTG54_012706 [Skeletonema marinoi]
MLILVTKNMIMLTLLTSLPRRPSQRRENTLLLLLFSSLVPSSFPWLNISGMSRMTIHLISSSTRYPSLSPNHQRRRVGSKLVV